MLNIFYEIALKANATRPSWLLVNIISSNGLIQICVII